MLRCLSFLGITILSLLFTTAFAQETTTTVIEKHVIITPPPTAVCATIAGHWEGNIWVDKHDVCKYENRAEGVAWINPYWSCVAFTDDGSCTNWAWVPGHWEKTAE